MVGWLLRVDRLVLVGLGSGGGGGWGRGGLDGHLDRLLRRGLVNWGLSWCLQSIHK